MDNTKIFNQLDAFVLIHKSMNDQKRAKTPKKLIASEMNFYGRAKMTEFIMGFEMQELNEEIENAVLILNNGDLLSSETRYEFKIHLQKLLALKRCIIEENHYENFDRNLAEVSNDLITTNQGNSNGLPVAELVPLTKKQLKQGGWFMRSTTQSDADAFRAIGMRVFYDKWDDWDSDIYVACNFDGNEVVRVTRRTNFEKKNTKEIYCVDGNFYFR